MPQKKIITKLTTEFYASDGYKQALLAFASVSAIYSIAIICYHRYFNVLLHPICATLFMWAWAAMVWGIVGISNVPFPETNNKCDSSIDPVRVFVAVCIFDAWSL